VTTAPADYAIIRGCLTEELTMREMLQFYIDGRWVDPAKPRPFDVINPATGEVCGRISLGTMIDVDRAVTAASRAQDGYAQTTRQQRIELLDAILVEFKKRHDEVAKAIMEEMGAPWSLARDAQAASGPQHIKAARDALKDYVFEERHGTTLIVKEPIGVGADNAVELADKPDRLQGGARAGGRLHDGAEAERDRAAVRLPVRADPARGRRAGRGVQSGQRRAPASAPLSCHPASNGLVHRLDRAGVAVGSAAPSVNVSQELGGKSAT
jgi:hypothetical protein